MAVRLNDGALIDPPFTHWIWLIPAFLIGSCIGSFLNVVIYRVPLGMSVNEPNRSFCPKCKKPIPLWLNLPLISWLWLRGKCAECGAPISFRYFGVELLTALLFTAVWWFFPLPQVAIFLWVLMAILVSITFIDAEHMIIPTRMTTAGSIIGLAAAAVYPQLPVLGAAAGNWLSGLKQAGIGWAVGYCGLWLVVEFGKKAFGKRELKYTEPQPWELREATNDQDPMLFVMAAEEISWWDIFSRKTDRLLVQATDIVVDGASVGAGLLTIREEEIELPDGTVRRLENMKSLSGSALSTVIPREAMGKGDIHLLGMVGAFFGWSGVFFTLFSSSVFALIAALIGRVGFGKPLPFGPFLAMGCVAWAFGGWKLWEWYLFTLQPF